MNKIVNFTTRMPENINVKAKTLAKNRGYPLNTLILILLENYVEKEESRCK